VNEALVCTLNLEEGTKECNGEHPTRINADFIMTSAQENEDLRSRFWVDRVRQV
jgi:hypothetical protein